MKNMLLVMSTSGVFDHSEDDHTLQLTQKAQEIQDTKRHYSALWQVTWERIDCFLPNLRRDMLASRSPFAQRASSPPIYPEPEAQTMETEGRPMSDDESTKISQDEKGQFCSIFDIIVVPNLRVSLCAFCPEPSTGKFKSYAVTLKASAHIARGYKN